MGASSPFVALLVKLAAATVTSAVALLAFRQHSRREALAALRRDIRRSLLRMGAGAACRVIVLGFPSHGKSSFVNTAWRALAGEGGPFLARAETGPALLISDPLVFRLPVPDADAGYLSEVREEEDGEPTLELVDSSGLPEAGKLTRDDVQASLSGALPAPNCGVVVLRCSGPQKTNLRKLHDIAAIIRERGLRLVVVLTHRNSLKSKKQLEELRREVALWTETDCVYFIENYTASGGGAGDVTAFKNRFSTDYSALAIVRQCIEFAAIHRASEGNIPSPPPPLSHGANGGST